MSDHADLDPFPSCRISPITSEGEGGGDHSKYWAVQSREITPNGANWGFNGGLAKSGGVNSGVNIDLYALSSSTISPIVPTGEVGNDSKCSALQSPRVTPRAGNWCYNGGLPQSDGVNADLYAVPICKISPMAPPMGEVGDQSKSWAVQSPRVTPTEANSGFNGGLTQSGGVITDLDGSAISPMPLVGGTGDPSKGWALESLGVTPSGANCCFNDDRAQSGGVNANLYALQSCRISPMPPVGEVAREAGDQSTSWAEHSRGDSLSGVNADLYSIPNCIISPMPGEVGEAGDQSKSWTMQSPEVTPSGASWGFNGGLAQSGGVITDLDAPVSWRISPIVPVGEVGDESKNWAVQTPSGTNSCFTAALAQSGEINPNGAGYGVVNDGQVVQSTEVTGNAASWGTNGELGESSCVTAERAFEVVNGGPPQPGGVISNGIDKGVDGRLANRTRSNGSKGQPWSIEEHKQFLLGLEKFRKGDWKNISRYFVPSRTATQVGSHAQKYFDRLRRTSKPHRKSVLDITSVHETDALEGSLGPVTEQSSPSDTEPTASPSTTPNAGQPHAHAEQPGPGHEESMNGCDLEWASQEDSESFLGFLSHFTGDSNTHEGVQPSGK